MTPNWENCLRLAHKTSALLAAQEINGVGFDKEKAVGLVEHIKQEMKVIADKTLPLLPPRPLKEGEKAQFTMPKKPYRMNGEFSTLMEKFVEKHGGSLDAQSKTASIMGKTYPVVGGAQLDVQMPMELGEQDALKQWLMSIGWSPTFWNYKKDENGKPKRDKKGKLEPTSPKIQEAQKICPHLESMDMPLVKDIVKWMSYRNRLSILEGWLKNPRLEFDGRLTAGASGVTNTGRLRHHTCVNVPKAEDSVLLGKEFRDLFIPSPGNLFVNYDAAALESRVAAHYTWRYDQGAFARELLEGDIHATNTKVFFPEETARFDIHSPAFSKDDPGFKPYRSKSKNGFYCAVYGGGPGKMASTLGKAPERGKELFDAFWESNSSLKMLRENLERFWEYQGGKKYIIGLDGRKVFTRNPNGVLNCLFQSAGAIIMDLSTAYMDKWLGGMRLNDKGRPVYQVGGFEVRRVTYHHDELGWDCPPEVAAHVGELGVKSIVAAGKHFKLNVALDGEWKSGSSWRYTH